MVILLLIKFITYLQDNNYCYYVFSGLIKAISSFDGTGKGTFVGILILMIAVAYGIAAAGDLLMLTKVIKKYIIKTINTQIARFAQYVQSAAKFASTGC